MRVVPAVAHQQGRKHSCVLSSAASALVFVGETKAALAVAARIPISLAHDNPMTLLHDAIDSEKFKTVEVVEVFKRGGLDLLRAMIHRLTRRRCSCSARTAASAMP